ncbi:hypothetical protein MKK67_05160 [Methylobacterium sp. J-072]|uniref:hypothetical protein n=1 Tax=Methylobacterium sp. J-072 TaxID=2836651 RepID=UPI001FBAE1CD|nr:hypothetical protein [Methylobacterium sp. J-072]MCJ2091896.1 hypothetical protein [Methylobacterium sp. J-072]
MALSDLPRTRPTETDAQTRAREDAARVETARRDFDSMSARIAAARPLAPAKDDLSDLDLLEAATALSTAKR